MPNKIILFNPLSHDFSWTWKDDNNKPHLLTIKSRDTASFDEPIGKFMRKHLADQIINERGFKINPEQDYKDIFKEVTVEI